MSHRVLITTLSLNGNYGGILQAFALQRVVRDLGFEPVTDTSRPKSLLKRLRWRLLQQPYRWFRRVSRSRSDRQWLMSRRVTAPLRAFVAQNIRTGSYMEIAGTPRGRARLARRFRTFVVGSDQVWRARYADIPTQFLDVLEPSRAAGRVGSRTRHRSASMTSRSTPRTIALAPRRSSGDSTRLGARGFRRGDLSRRVRRGR